MNIGIIGTGGVGGYFGGKLAKSSEGNKDNHVFFLARGEHLAKIQENGLTVILNKEKTINCKPYLASDKTTDFPVLDVCLICVKGYDLINVLKNLKSIITEKTEIVPLLNGIDIPQRIKSIIPNALIFPSCVYIGTHIKEPGIIEQHGGSTKIITGPDKSNKQITKYPKFPELFDKADIMYKWTTDNYKYIWEKYMFVAPCSIVSAFYNKTLGQVNEDPELLKKVKKICDLIFEISEFEGVGLNSNCPQETIAKLSTLPFEIKTSFQRDFEKKNKPTEKETFIDTLILLAKKYNLDASCVIDIVKK
ncbi:MAG: ketopantoate reductase family protein [Clostridium sp.]